MAPKIEPKDLTAQDRTFLGMAVMTYYAQGDLKFEYDAGTPQHIIDREAALIAQYGRAIEATCQNVHTWRQVGELVTEHYTNRKENES